MSLFLPLWGGGGGGGGAPVFLHRFSVWEGETVPFFSRRGRGSAAPVLLHEFSVWEEKQWGKRSGGYDFADLVFQWGKQRFSWVRGLHTSDLAFMQHNSLNKACACKMEARHPLYSNREPQANVETQGRMVRLR